MKLDRCQALVERDKRVVAPCQHLSYYPLAVAKVDGSVITDLDGNEFIDFLSSASTLNLGSSHPVITAAIKRQLEKFVQYTPAYSYNEQTTTYAEKLASVYPGGVKAKVCFGNCGSDCNDAAIKFSRAYTGRQKIIVFLNGYHGNTYDSSTMTTCSTRMHEKMGPFLPEIYPFPFFGTDKSGAEVERDCMKAMETAFSSYLPPSEVAAMVIEPVQGDGGMLPAHPIFMKKLYETCKKYGILFISEEVQQGFYRTGKFFSIEHYGIIPDGIVMGKAAGASLTLGAFMARAEIMDCLPAPAHVFTLSGNSIACAAGIAQFDYMESEEFQKQLASNIVLIEKLGADLKAKHPKLVAFSRNLGLSMGIGIQKEDGSPDADGVFKILFRSYEKGLVVISLAGWILRIQPPLTIEPELLIRGFEILDQAMCEYERGEIPDDVFQYRSGW